MLLFIGSRDEKKSSHFEETNELILDGGFPLPKLVSKDAFLVPEINSFGQSFRFEFHFFFSLFWFTRDSSIAKIENKT